MLDRVYGKPVQPTEDLTGNSTDRSWDEMTEEKQQAALDAARKRWQDEQRDA